MTAEGARWLLGAGLASLVASALHLGCIAGGAPWYRFFGAGEGMATRAARGDAYPTMITLAIAAVLVIWALYAFSGAGMIGRLPLLRTGLALVSAVLLARALLWLPGKALSGSPIGRFDLWSSAIVLGYGTAFAIGTVAAWPRLTQG